MWDRLRRAWWNRFAILAALVATVIFSQYCGITKSLAPRVYCGVCAVFFGAPNYAFELRVLPDWYVLPSYGLLHSMMWNLGPISAKLLGIIVMLAAWLLPLSLAIYRWANVRAGAWISLAVLPFALFGLGWAATLLPFDPAYVWAAPVFTGLYFLEFIVVFPLLAGRRSLATVV